MHVRPYRDADRSEWLRMSTALFPEGAAEEHEADMRALRARDDAEVFVVARPGGGLAGYVEAGTRPYADGCVTSPVGYVEAWYVDPDVRRAGLGRALLDAAEAWARSRGYREMASDALLDNEISQRAHERAGYEVVDRVVQFRKPLTAHPGGDRTPSVIVVMGVAGAGKTTVGVALAESLGWRFHDADAFHLPESVARMREGMPLTEAHRQPWLDALRALVAGALADGERLVLACSALRAAHRSALVPPAAPQGSVRFAYLRVRPAVLRERLERRRGHFASAVLLESQMATLEEPAPEEENALWLDGERPVPYIVAQLRRELGLAPEPPVD